VGNVRKHKRGTGAEREKQIADATLRLVAKHGVHGATISRIAAAVGVSRAALYKHFPNREAMLRAALDLSIERGPGWIDQGSGDDGLGRIMDLGRQHGALDLSVWEVFVRPWYQFAAASGHGSLIEGLSEKYLRVVRMLAELVEEGKRDGSVREDVDTEVVAWTLMMWAWAEDIARLVGVGQVISSGVSVEVFRRMLGDIAASSRGGEDGRSGRLSTQATARKSRKEP
jgi:AcrR family transcriptional regulator